LLLVDCNNFFVSCEKVFNPKLEGKPVAVLSSNDGCIVARSKELKMLGVPMGAPAFMYREVFERNAVYLLSSNFSLYADMSKRVIECLKRHCLEIEVYSVDEAFLTVPLVAVAGLAKIIRKEVLMWTGIPVSIGAAKTKTLAKLAASVAKNSDDGVFLLLDEALIVEKLNSTAVSEIWGIGRKTDEALKKQAIYTALQLTQKPPEWVRKKFGVGLLRSALELKNIAVLNDEGSPSKKSITHSRSFGSALNSFEEVAEALSGFTARAAEKLREQNSASSYLEVFVIKSGPLREVYSQIVHFEEPTSHTPTLISYAKLGLKAIFKEGFSYKKTGVTLNGIISESHIQTDFFSRNNGMLRPQKKLMELVDNLNHKFGKKTVFFAAEGVCQNGPKSAKCDKRTPRYTTCWDELLTVHI